MGTITPNYPPHLSDTAASIAEVIESKLQAEISTPVIDSGGNICYDVFMNLEKLQRAEDQLVNYYQRRWQADVRAKEVNMKRSEYIEALRKAATEQRVQT